MEKEKIDSILVNFIKSNLSPTQHEREMISKEYKEICDLLVGDEIFHSGSYARFTSVTPVSDLDIVWVIPQSIIEQKMRTSELSEKAVDPRSLNLSDILTDFSKKLEREYARIGRNVTVEAQTHSVGVYFGSEDYFSIDIVPAIKSGEKNEYKEDIYFIPEDGNEGIIWKKSDPRGYILEARELNDTNESFRRVSKFVKKWKNNCEDRNKLFSLKSFHLETIVKHLIIENKDSTAYDTLINFYSDLDYYLSEPKFPDRADQSVFIDDYIRDLSEDQIEIITRAKEHALDLLEEIKKSSDEAQVLKLVEDIISGSETLAARIGHIFKQVLSYLAVPPAWQKPLPWPKRELGKIDVKCYLDNAQEIQSKKQVFSNHSLKFVAEYHGDYDDIYWQVVNTGDHAESIGIRALRGDFFKAKDLNNNLSSNPLISWERTEYHGSHWITCFAIKGGECIASSSPFFVNIFNKNYMRYKRPRRR
jgi:hypothetical protein